MLKTNTTPQLVNIELPIMTNPLALRFVPILSKSLVIRQALVSSRLVMALPIGCCLSREEKYLLILNFTSGEK
jgi:hypothetical protein